MWNTSFSRERGALSKKSIEEIEYFASFHSMSRGRDETMEK